MKRDALNIEEKDIKREAFELSLPLLRKQAAILQYAYPEEMFLQEEPSEYLDELSNEEIGNIIAGLIIIPISKLDSHYKERAARSRDDRIAHERFLIMERSFYIDKKFNDSWNFCRENQIEPVKLQSLLAIHCIENTMAKRMEQGQASYEKGLNTPSVVVDVSSEESSRVIINQDLIKYLLEFNLAVDEVVLDTKLVHRLSIMDKSNTKALHSLMKNLRTSFSFKLVSSKESVFEFLSGYKKTTKVSLNDLKRYLDVLSLESSLYKALSFSSVEDPFSQTLGFSQIRENPEPGTGDPVVIELHNSSQLDSDSADTMSTDHPETNSGK
jgi:hypothetical protein